MPSRLLRLVASWLLVALGVPLLLRAELGVSPFDVLNTGVARATGWSFGVCFVVNSITLFLLGRLLGARLGWACIAGTLVIGPLVDVVLDWIPSTERLAVRIPYLVAGILIIAVAICLVVTTDLGAGPAEVFMLGLVTRGMPIVRARWISDGVPVLLGAVLGGRIGVGTVLFAVAMGPMVTYGLRVLQYTPPRRPTSAAQAVLTTT